MAHLSDETFIDLLDGTLVEDAVPHLSICRACRDQLAELRMTWQLAAAADVPEPSPLFWGHLAKRIREDVAREQAAQPAGWLERLRAIRLSWWRVGGLVGAVAAALLVVALQVPREHRATPVPASVDVTSPSTTDADDSLRAAEPDDTLGFVTDLVSGLDWDATAELGVPSASAIDGSLASLNDDERVALRNLLNDALRGGA